MQHQLETYASWVSADAETIFEDFARLAELDALLPILTKEDAEHYMALHADRPRGPHLELLHESANAAPHIATLRRSVWGEMSRRVDMAALACRLKFGVK